MLEVCLCKPAIYQLKILGGREFEYYKLMGGTTKRGGETKVEKQKGGRGWEDYDFWLKFSGEKNLWGNYGLIFVTIHSEFVHFKSGWVLKVRKGIN